MPLRLHIAVRCDLYDIPSVTLEFDHCFFRDHLLKVSVDRSCKHIEFEFIFEHSVWRLCVSAEDPGSILRLAELVLQLILTDVVSELAEQILRSHTNVSEESRDR